MFDELPPMSSTDQEIVSKWKRKPFSTPDNILGLTGKYRNEDFNLYNEKKGNFMKLTEKYNDFNEIESLEPEKKNLEAYKDFCGENSENLFNFAYRQKKFAELDDLTLVENGRKERKRLEKINERNFLDEEIITDFWSLRYFSANRFIHLIRGVILKNRMKKNLKELKKLGPAKIAEFERVQPKPCNVSYSTLFEKFL